MRVRIQSGFPEPLGLFDILIAAHDAIFDGDIGRITPTRIDIDYREIEVDVRLLGSGFRVREGGEGEVLGGTLRAVEIRASEDGRLAATLDKFALPLKGMDAAIQRLDRSSFQSTDPDVAALWNFFVDTGITYVSPGRVAESTLDSVGIESGAIRTKIPYGMNGNDKLTLSRFDEVFRAGKGADTVRGEGGADELRGGSGNDVLFGGDGDDRLFGDGGADRLFGDAGADTLFGGGGRDRLNGGAGDDQLYGGGGNDELVGGAGEDFLVGGAGADRLFGGAGRDQLEGGAGADQLDGGAGADRLFGGGGDDILEGGKGNDRLTGGAGRDVFLFDGRKLGRDVIADFEQGRDTVRIDSPRVDGFRDLQKIAIGGDAAVRWDGTTVIFDGIAPGALRASDFDFV